METQDAMLTTTQLDDVTLQQLRDRMRGTVLVPGDDGYDEARTVWNVRLESQPAAVAQCTGTADVMAAVKVAREQSLLLTVKGGGHSYAGNAACDDGLMIDLSPMKGVRVDPEGQTARVQAGATWGQFDHEAQAFGLATTGATVSTVGIAGYTLGGGTGYLARKHGLSADSLISADIVTADGRLVHASEDEHPDLFWGLRGGGATSASSRPSSFGSTRSARPCWPGRSSIHLRRPRTCSGTTVISCRGAG